MIISRNSKNEKNSRRKEVKKSRVDNTAKTVLTKRRWG